MHPAAWFLLEVAQNGFAIPADLNDFCVLDETHRPNKFRRKHLLEPSHEVEEFDQQPIPKECVTSPGEKTLPLRSHARGEKERWWEDVWVGSGRREQERETHIQRGHSCHT